jgi:hypothetical protein
VIGNGGLYLSQNFVLRRLTEEDGFFYHKGLFVDIDGDGLLDIITARAKKPLFGAGKGQLMWLKNPNNSSQFPWESVVLADGPDIDVELGPKTAQGQVLRESVLVLFLKISISCFQIVFAAEFFGKKISSFLISDTGTFVSSKVIDDTIGEGYAVKYFSAKKGSDILFASNYQAKDSGSVFAYSGNNRTVLATFKNVQKAPVKRRKGKKW